MALTVISSPPTLAPVRQPLRLVLQTDNYQLTAGTKARLRINVSGAANGNNFTITIANKAYVFTARTTPDANSAFEFATNADTELLVANIVAMFASNPFIADNFDVTYSVFPFWVQLEAKIAGIGGSMQFIASTASFSSAANVAGVNATFQPSFKVLLYLGVNGITVLKDARVDALNRCEFVLEELLDNFLQPAVPTLALDAITYVNVAPLSYTLGFAESYGINPLIQKRTSIARQVLPGLFDKQAQPTAVLTPYTTALTNRKMWITKPLALTVKAHQLVLVAVYSTVVFNALDIKIKYILKRADGFLANEIAASIDDVYAIAASGIVCVYASVEQLSEAIGILPNDLYEMQVALSAVQVSTPSNRHTSEFLRLNIDHAEQGQEVALLFKAANGLFEIVYFEGDTESQVQTTRSFADHLLPANYTAASGEIKEVEVTRQKRYVLHSGLKPRDYITWLQELVGSNEIYMLTGGSARTRVNVVAHSDDLSSTNQELHSMQVTIQEAFIDRA